MLQMRGRVFYVAIAVLSVLAQTGALVVYHVSGDEGLPATWTGQFRLVILLSTLLSTTLPLVSERSVVWLWLTLRLGLILVAGAPFGENVTIELLLFTSLLLEGLAHVRLGPGIAVAIAVVAVAWLSQRPFSTWGRLRPAPSRDSILFLVLHMTIVAALMLLVRYNRDRLVPYREVQSRLDESTLQLAQANLKLQEYAALVQERTLQAERKRMSREIHDTLAYTLTNLVMTMEAGIALVGDQGDPVTDLLQKARTQAKEGLSEVRRAVKALRPLPVARSRGMTAIHNLVTTFENATSVRIRLQMGDVPQSLGAETDSILYRLTQEGITNALRHGKATEVAVYFACRDGGVLVDIIDNGAGTDDVVEGYGITGMRERIEQSGGSLAVTGNSKRGFRVTAWVPGPDKEKLSDDQSPAG